MLAPRLQNETAEVLADIDGLPVLVRFHVQDIPAEVQSELVSRGADVHSLLSNTLAKMIDRMRGSCQRTDAPSKTPLTIVELLRSGDSLARLPVQLNETVLRVGPIELDLLDRTAKRGDRRINLRPREFQLLKYMMQRSDTLLTRATLLKEVWHYKFVPKTNLVDVHLGRLRRKVDGSNEAPLIRNVRGEGFVLSATPLSHGYHRGRPMSATAMRSSPTQNPAWPACVVQLPEHDIGDGRGTLPGSYGAAHEATNRGCTRAAPARPRVTLRI